MSDGSCHAAHGGRQAHPGVPVSATAVAAVARSTIEAQLIVGMLEANGIIATISTDDAGGMEPQLQLTGGVRVIVPTEDLARAGELIAERGD